ncbi:hypothetical protein HOLleu_43752 [Holothuria leucospilota]|uniref:Uncharacterized protein n=1 Tax=Holothuria leucospilota TaxID=206669 RepID=A0A9Q0YAE4_HOLLE|nr:hypothetical protein HOLleu_43752 [Holothuria leucospilota]
MIRSSVGWLVIRMMPHYCKKTWIGYFHGLRLGKCLFNADKCKVLHFGPKNFSYDYS